MRFFFHLHNSVETRDQEGRDLPSLAVAVEAAETDARSIASENVRQGHLNLSHSVEITDGTGKSLYRIMFGEAVEVTD
ncbi:DUF6894 family protein [Altererythrobacter sp. Root672]|uniref:DUF6894 family protein n=1 Tax=Altererythrobacter sp. Root672 TaxID=1736584 RepID=UPI0006F8B02B|nr:hypothetical protein [Altererythrobacter sp. Root672]KRA83973.1 hypothetical protein ASD76_08200 [Altererythrobacter sp. Root672]